MNERIRELLVKAGVKLQARRPYVDEDPDGYLESDNDFFLNNREAIMLLEEGGLEKFAELIVRECLSVVGRNIRGPHGEYDYSYSDADAAADSRAQGIHDDIKYHFGIE